MGWDGDLTIDAFQTIAATCPAITISFAPERAKPVAPHIQTTTANAGARRPVFFDLVFRVFIPQLDHWVY